ncbi:MAG TPA: 5-formyltetrahydrofolate cyclo-ligase [Verrucomicrobiota bacterium]|nr:5-formyltetrahydrofolate cyclo-ligase [Verrucomicrobiota bacterium]
MQPSLTGAKSELRQKMRARLAATSGAHRTVEAAQICARMKGSDVWQSAGTVLLFVPLSDEPDVWPLLEFALHEQKLVALPFYEAQNDVYTARQVTDLVADLRTGKFGVREPKPDCSEVALNRLDLVLVPGVAFDARCRRLGRGRGFYDRLLAVASGRKCGVAFDEQIVAEVPAGPQDIHLNCILTPTRWIET